MGAISSARLLFALVVANEAIGTPVAGGTAHVDPTYGAGTGARYDQAELSLIAIVGNGIKAYNLQRKDDVNQGEDKGGGERREIDPVE
jgi:hypothetical protein